MNRPAEPTIGMAVLYDKRAPARIDVIYFKTSARPGGDPNWLVGLRFEKPTRLRNGSLSHTVDAYFNDLEVLDETTA